MTKCSQRDRRALALTMLSEVTRPRGRTTIHGQHDYAEAQPLSLRREVLVRASETEL
jgi:hypothetical protein